jgi:hypothetical protein
MSMGVYIKGMEMPTSCTVCPMLEGDRLDGLCHAASKWLDDDEHWTWYVYPEGDMDDSKPCNCPLVPVPEHGRLIDASEKIRVQMYDDMTEDYHIAEMTIDDLLSQGWVEADAPTIIPASGGRVNE